MPGIKEMKKNDGTWGGIIERPNKSYAEVRPNVGMRIRRDHPGRKAARMVYNMLGDGLCGTSKTLSSVRGADDRSALSQPASALPCSNLAEPSGLLLNVAQFR
jgi:hypothetical protein